MDAQGDARGMITKAEGPRVLIIVVAICSGVFFVLHVAYEACLVNATDPHDACSH